MFCLSMWWWLIPVASICGFSNSSVPLASVHKGADALQFSSFEICQVFGICIIERCLSIAEHAKETGLRWTFDDSSNWWRSGAWKQHIFQPLPPIYKSQNAVQTSFDQCTTLIYIYMVLLHGICCIRVCGHRQLWKRPFYLGVKVIDYRESFSCNGNSHLIDIDGNSNSI